MGLKKILELCENNSLFIVWGVLITAFLWGSFFTDSSIPARISLATLGVTIGFALWVIITYEMTKHDIPDASAREMLFGGARWMFGGLVVIGLFFGAFGLTLKQAHNDKVTKTRIDALGPLDHTDPVFEIVQFGEREFLVPVTLSELYEAAGIEDTE